MNPIIKKRLEEFDKEFYESGCVAYAIRQFLQESMELMVLDED